MRIVQTEKVKEKEQEKINKLIQKLGPAETFEELVFHALDEGFRLEISALRKDLRAPAICVYFTSSFLFGATKRSACAIIEAEQWKRWAKFDLLNANVRKFADQNGVIHDTDWFAERDKKLRIKIDPWKGETTAPAASLWPLAASYILTPKGTVTISREIVEMSLGCPFVAQLNLTCPSKHHTAFFNEVVSIVLSKIGGVIERRRSREAQNRPTEQMAA